MKKLILNIPELILLGLTIFWFLDNYIGGKHFNPYAFGVFVILLLQVFLQNKYIGFIMESIIALFSIYMLLAVLSEFHDFPTYSLEAFQLLGFGLLLCTLGFGSSIALFIKFIPKVF
jgi:VIT1/CCC1 family predicted Fe2+/Mn2+ transporter